MKAVFLNRYQDNVERGAEVFVGELAKRLSRNHSVDIFSGKKADSIQSILRGKFDIVIPVNGRLQSLIVSLAKFIGGYKVLITGHSGKGWDDIWNISIAKPDVFIALTNDMASWARKFAWGSKIIKIPNGIDLEKYSPTGGKIKINLPRPIILSVGALVWYKHHEKVIEAVSKMRTGSVLIVGDGPLKDRLRKEGEEKLRGRIKITQFRNEEMPDVYRSCDLFTLPSWDREAFGIVYLEAMASGLGVVAPVDLSRKEIIGKAGLLIDTSDNILYSQSIAEAVDINWQKIARNQAEKFSWEKITKQYEDVMMELIND